MKPQKRRRNPPARDIPQSKTTKTAKKGKKHQGEEQRNVGRHCVAMPNNPTSSRDSVSQQQLVHPEDISSVHPGQINITEEETDGAPTLPNVFGQSSENWMPENNCNGARPAQPFVTHGPGSARSSSDANSHPMISTGGQNLPVQNIETALLYTLGSSPIKSTEVEKALIDYPDRSAAESLLNGLKFGFKLNYSGPRLPYDPPMQSEIIGEKAVIAGNKIQKEISLGRIAGPFTSPPFPTFRVSPIFVTPKKSSPEFRLIHNFSSPTNHSVNDFINKEYSSVKYASIDDAVKMIHNLGSNALLGKCDIKSAFRLLRLSPSEFDLTGFKFQNKYYFDKCLPMGVSISSALFESFSTALHWFVQTKSKNDSILHYLDDFLFGGKSGTDQCLRTLEVFKNSCELWGVPLADDKTVTPTEVLVFLGIEFDTRNMVMRLPKEKLTDLENKIHYCIKKSKITLRELQSLIGVLNFTCQVIVPGRAFCRRLIDATCNVNKPHHKIRVSKGMKNDLTVWLNFLENYNGTTVLLDQFWSSNSDLELYTDSAGGKGLSFGIFFEGKWSHACWPEPWQDSDILLDITFLELFPVVAALHIWGSYLKDKKILFHIDNLSVVSIINKKSSKSPRVMVLVRKLVFACLYYNILLRAEHIPGRLNCLADSLSRSDFQRFRELCPTADEKPYPIPSHLWTI